MTVQGSSAGPPVRVSCQPFLDPDVDDNDFTMSMIPLPQPPERSGSGELRAVSLTCLIIDVFNIEVITTK
jgi:hypothetical protein